MFDAVYGLAELTGRLNAVRQVSVKLLRNDPGHSADQLVTVLQEVSKTFSAFELDLVRYLSLQFQATTRDRDRRELVALEGGAARQRSGEFRARCSKIGVLYHQVLRGWFMSSPISPDELRELDELFLALEDSDGNVIIPAVSELAAWIENKVSETLSLVDDGRFDDADAYVIAARHEILPLRREMGRIVGEFRDLEFQFTA
ncbi:hypothetical protein DMB66_02145 [Actinoplanes sp. ATCC 53533]|uniref:hypothetical protein n=1 Tax=Actinoplanes sp. ATCC 53533 TaxID=1288362 RepID=UPI000F7A15F8|nr:hypothetical protein [Actinoplanes sp. ATCC 53533]RSM74232.1 hypothetical protein DMB66_02145 [Actinoplanes sp. ATCC 53533]